MKSDPSLKKVSIIAGTERNRLNGRDKAGYGGASTYGKLDGNDVG
jgi:hypothetical protein